ncbi:MAG: hypothetical protein ACTSSK_09475 [Candidatus Heimdallarchaeota archaeon]
MSNVNGHKLDEIKTAIQDITVGIIFCPLCGKENNFSHLKSKEVKHYFCSYCQRVLSTLWDDYYSGKSSLSNCDQCHSSTFANQKYCINCGFKNSGYIPQETMLTSKKSKRYLDSKRKSFLIVFLAAFIILLITQLIVIFSLMSMESPLFADVSGFAAMLAIIIAVVDSQIIAAIITAIYYRIKIMNQKKQNKAETDQ